MTDMHSERAEDSSGREVLGVFQRSEKVRVEVAWRTWRGERALDFRLFVRNKAGRWVPTIKGVGFDPAQVGQLEMTLRRALTDTQSECLGHTPAS